MTEVYAQNDRICTPELEIINKPAAMPNGGSVRVRAAVVSDGPGQVSSGNGWSGWLGAAVRGRGDR
jgi:hypothetical protein